MQPWFERGMIEEMHITKQDSKDKLYWTNIWPWKLHYNLKITLGVLGSEVDM